MSSPATTNTPAASTSNPTSDNAKDTPTDNISLDAVVDELLDGLNRKFASVSLEIYEKIEAMSRRLDAMESSLQRQAGEK